MFATYLEIVELFGIVTVLFVSAVVALWLRDYGAKESLTRPVTLSEEARSSLLRAKAANAQKAAAKQKAAKKSLKLAHRQAFELQKSRE